MTGTVSDADGAAANVVVVATILDRDGNPIGTAGSTVTDEDGAFVLRTSSVANSGQLLLEATTAGGTLRALVGSEAQDVDPVTDGIAAIVRMIAGSPQGAALADFSGDELSELVSSAADALDLAGTDLSDARAVQEQLLLDLGREIADAAGGAFDFAASEALTPPAPADVLASIDVFNLELIDGDNERWDITSQGSISDGTDDAYDTGFALLVNGNAFPGQTAGTATTQTEDGREAVLGPVVDLGGTGLDVTRKIHVSDTLGFARFMEVLSNPTAAEIVVNVLIATNLGSDEDVDSAMFTASGDTVVDGADHWLANHMDSSDPAVAFFFPGASPTKSADDIEYQWTSVAVPAGSTVTLFHWGFQRTGGPVEALAKFLQPFETSLPLDYYAGSSADEIDHSHVSILAPNLYGEPGSVAPLAEVTLTNTTSSNSVTVTAASDGSFWATLEAATDDEIHVTATDGTDSTLTIP